MVDSPDWPTCFGRWIPPTSVSQLPSHIDPGQFNFALAWIEYINRLIGMTVGILIAITAVGALISYRKHPRVIIASGLAGFLVAYQGWQGSRIIESQLDSTIVSIHMALAFIIAMMMMYTTFRGDPVLCRLYDNLLGGVIKRRSPGSGVTTGILYDPAVRRCFRPRRSQ